MTPEDLNAKTASDLRHVRELAEDLMLRQRGRKLVRALVASLGIQEWVRGPRIKNPIGLEKDIEQSGDIIMGVLGFETYKLSQPRASMQTPGFPDRLYFHEALGMAVWWEAKRSDNEQSAAQKTFERLCKACGWAYVAGDLSRLEEFCINAGIAERGRLGQLIALPPSKR